jgi:predicted RNase H-like HicB family nuclease
MKTYLFNIVIEPDEDFDGKQDGWHAFCPPLLKQGASAWGETREEAFANIREVIEMTMESLIEHGEPLPVGSGDYVQVLEGSRVAVTV